MAMKKLSAKDVLINQLRTELKEAKAYQIHNYHFASAELARCSTDRLLGSGIVFELTYLGGKRAVEPVVIRDGLSNETIAAIKADLKRSYDLATEFKP